MPRPLRVHVEGALHYVTASAIAPQTLFSDAKDYQAYLDLLQEYRAKHGFKLYGYVLFPDHLHLCLEPSETASVSAIMHALSSRYTKYFNRRHRHAGPLFQERFKSTLIEKAPSLHRLTAYLHLYPLRMGAVADLMEYRWTSYAEYLAAPAVPGTSLREEPGTATTEVLGRLAQEYPGLMYAQYVMSMTEPEWQQMRIELQQRAIGSPSFIARVEQRLTAPVKPQPVSHVVQPVRVRPARRPARLSMWRTVGMAACALALCVAVFSIRNITMLKQTLAVLAKENQRAFNVLGSGSRDTSPVQQLTAFNHPDQLNGSSWDVRIRPRFSTNVEASRADQVQFGDMKMASSWMGAQGFSGSNYAMRRDADGAIVWEAVQSGPNGAIAFWRGQTTGRIMTGSISRQPAGGGTPEEFVFTGVLQSQRKEASEI